MASEFKIKGNFRVIPLETVEFADTTQTCTKVHTNIDKTFGGSFEYRTGTAATSIRYKESYTTTTSAVALSHANIFNVSAVIRLLYVKILSQAGSQTPNAYIQLGDETTVLVMLEGVNDAVCVPVIGNTNSFKILSDTNKTANVEILIANMVL